jgi:hypothetical protein
MATSAGYPLALYLKDEGYTPDEVKEYEDAVKEQNKQAVELSTAEAEAKAKMVAENQPSISLEGNPAEAKSGGGTQGGVQGNA